MTKTKFYVKHHASAQEIMRGTFSLTCALADLRASAERHATKTGSEEMKALAAQLDNASAACVRLILRLPIEILMTIYNKENLA